MYLYLRRHVYTHVNVFFITMYICVYAYVPYPAPLSRFVGVELEPGASRVVSGCSITGLCPPSSFFLVVHRETRRTTGTHPNWWALPMTVFQLPHV